MLEILYDTTTKEVRAWNADESVLGNLDPQSGQEVVIFPIDPPTFDSDVYYVDLADQKLIPNPDYTPTPPVIFTPENPVMGVEHRLAHVESFLQGLYPPG